MDRNHSADKDANQRTPEHTHSEALRTSEFPRATGLPRIAAGEPVLLRGGAQWLIHARGSEIHGYRLRRCGDSVEAERSWQAKIEGTVTALADSRYGIVVTSQAEQHTDVWRIADSRAHHVAKVHGRISSVACLGTSAWVVLNRTGHSNAILTEVDLYRRVIASEQPLSSAQVKLSTDATGTYLGVLDLARGTFQMRNARAADPCGGGTDRGSFQNAGSQRPSDQPAPAGHSETNDCCCCRKGRGAEQQPGPLTGSQTPASGQPGGIGNGPCWPGSAGVPTPGGGSVTGNGGQVGHNPPPGSGGGRGPCVADLGWRSRIIASAASSYVVADAGGRHLAVLSGQDKRVLETRQFGRRGALVLADPSSPMVLIQHRSTSQWEVLHTDLLTQ